MRIPLERNDDRGFIKEVQTLIDGILPCFQPHELFVTRIDDWFDKNRLGVNTVPIPQTPTRKVSRLNVPWFSYGRIVENYYFEKNSDGHYHERKRGDISTLLGRKRARAIADISPNGLFMWVSGNSSVNGKGSLLIYYTKGGLDTGWYAGFNAAEA